MFEMNLDFFNKVTFLLKHKQKHDWGILQTSLSMIIFIKISFLDVSDCGEGETSATCLNLLEPSVHLNAAHIYTNLLLLSVGLFR